MEIDESLFENILQIINKKEDEKSIHQCFQIMSQKSSVLCFPFRLNLFFDQMIFMIQKLEDELCKAFDFQTIKNLMDQNSNSIHQQTILENRKMIFNCIMFSADEKNIKSIKKYMNDIEHIDPDVCDVFVYKKFIEKIIIQNECKENQKIDFNQMILIIDCMLFFLKNCSVFLKSSNCFSQDEWFEWFKHNKLNHLSKEFIQLEDLIQTLSFCWNDKSLSLHFKWFIFSIYIEKCFPFVDLIFSKTISDFVLDETKEKELYNPVNHSNKNLLINKIENHFKQKQLENWKKQINHI